MVPQPSTLLRALPKMTEKSPDIQRDLQNRDDAASGHLVTRTERKAQIYSHASVNRDKRPCLIHCSVLIATPLPPPRVRVEFPPSAG